MLHIWILKELNINVYLPLGLFCPFSFTVSGDGHKTTCLPAFQFHSGARWKRFYKVKWFYLCFSDIIPYLYRSVDQNSWQANRRVTRITLWLAALLLVVLLSERSCLQVNNMAAWIHSKIINNRQRENLLLRIKLEITNLLSEERVKSEQQQQQEHTSIQNTR